jgi:hypothetical protein
VDDLENKGRHSLRPNDDSHQIPSQAHQSKQAVYPRRNTGSREENFASKAAFRKKSYKSVGWYIKVYENKLIYGPVIFLRLAFTHKFGI